MHLSIFSTKLQKKPQTAIFYAPPIEVTATIYMIPRSDTATEYELNAVNSTINVHIYL